MRIGTRILLGFGAMVALTLGLGWYVLAKQAEVRNHTAQIETRDLRALDELRQIIQGQYHMRALRETAVAQTLLGKSHQSEDPLLLQDRWRQSYEQTRKLLADLEATAEEYEKHPTSTQRALQWGRIRQSGAEAHATLKELAAEVEIGLALLARTDLAQMAARAPVLSRLRQNFETKVMAVTLLAQEQIDIGRAEVAALHDQTRTATLIALAAAVLLGTLCALAIQRSITRPLATFMQFVERVGQGDLTQQAPVDRRDELGDLARSLNQMVAGLKDVAGQTLAGTENLSAATAEILASTQQQGASTTEQAAAVQQTTATMAEIAQSGAQISERAKQVAASTEATSAATQAGLQAVQNTTRTMEAIREQAEAVAENVVALSEKTQAVGEIIATVNDIAEQSHLLALNAAIEAAAAGEQGRSFSVVANEIKNLADQSKEATVQVRSILGDIQKGINSSVMLTEEAVKRSESGRQQADVTDRTIRQLADSIQQSVQAFQQIAAGANQQQIGFDQVTQAVRNIGQASDQSANGTRQLEKAAANLNALSQQLRKAVERYRM
ncbi:MAG: methyl-accepting chemotaxis protein [Acidobacteria bacterium]|nr:methyl-accepting chemotaxis protein [Acidobacteriota bacterium]